MELTVEERDDRVLVHSPDRQHTLLTLLKQAVWDVGGQAGYDKGHEYAGEATLVVSGDEPRETLDDAVDAARDELDAFRDAFESA